MIDFKKLHKIRGVEKEVCTAEQKIAENALWFSGYETDKKKYLARFEKDYADLLAKYNGVVIIALINAHWDKYKEKTRIFNSYRELGNFLDLEVLENVEI